jgi:hypothetical protein
MRDLTGMSFFMEAIQQDLWHEDRPICGYRKLSNCYSRNSTVTEEVKFSLKRTCVSKPAVSEKIGKQV